MGVMVGTIFKWFKPGEDWTDPDNGSECCLDGQCVGIVTEVTDPANDPKGHVSVKWWEMCRYHLEVDPKGTGPYDLDYIWQIGQLY